MEHSILQVVGPLAKHRLPVHQQNLMRSWHAHDCSTAYPSNKPGKFFGHALVLRSKHLHYGAIVHDSRPTIRIQSAKLTRILDKHPSLHAISPVQRNGLPEWREIPYMLPKNICGIIQGLYDAVHLF
jgi:hypothetical protein